MLLTNGEIKLLERRYRANLLNSILGYKPANLVGTKSSSGVDNLAIFSSAIHLGADPALVGLLSRPHTVRRHTLENIRSSQSFTINHVSSDFLDKAHRTSAKYPEGLSEFEQTGLSPHFEAGVHAPFVKESEVSLGLTLREIVPLKINGTLLIIGEIEVLLFEEDLVLDDGSLDFELLQTVAVTGLDTYHKASRLKKLPYARP